MQSCSKRNELPLNAKLCVRFLFLIHAEYSKVSSFFFCAKFDLSRNVLRRVCCVEMSGTDLCCSNYFMNKTLCCAISLSAKQQATHWQSNSFFVSFSKPCIFALHMLLMFCIATFQGVANHPATCFFFMIVA